jgi:hypothetical protein
MVAGFFFLLLPQARAAFFVAVAEGRDFFRAAEMLPDELTEGFRSQPMEREVFRVGFLHAGKQLRRHLLSTPRNFQTARAGRIINRLKLELLLYPWIWFSSIKRDARKLIHDQLKELRIRAVGAVQSGESPEVVARAMGINRVTIYGWIALYRSAGLGPTQRTHTRGT